MKNKQLEDLQQTLPTERELDLRIGHLLRELSLARQLLRLARKADTYRSSPRPAASEEVCHAE